MQFYTVFLTALFVAMVLVDGLMRVAHRFDFVDVPDARKVHVGAIPRIGGIGMVLGVFAAVWLWMDPSDIVRVFLAGILVIACFGLWDDRTDLDYRMKFVGQLLAVAIVVFGGDVMIRNLSFAGCYPLPEWVSASLTVLFLLGMTNAVNLADGLDGLAGGVSLLSLVCVAALASLSGATELLLVSVAIMGGTMGFLRYNTHPALVFMGDTGSQFLGFGLGVLTIWLTQRANTALAPELPLLIVGLPVIDTLVVMGQRLANGRSPFAADRNHFHHKLLDLGFDHYEAVLAIYLIQALFVISAYLMRYETGYAVLGAYAVLFWFLVLSYPLAVRFGWRLHAADATNASWLRRGIEKFRRNHWLVKLAHRFTTAMLVFLFMAGSVVFGNWSRDTGYLCLAITAVVLMFQLLPLPHWGMVQRLAIYSCILFIVQKLNGELFGDWEQYRGAVKLFFMTLAITLGVGVYNARRKHFKLTPSDFLVMLVLLMTATLPLFRRYHLDYLLLEAVILFYGVEFVLRCPGRCAKLISASSLIALLVIGVRALA